jgi:hypothetical protein
MRSAGDDRASLIIGRAYAKLSDFSRLDKEAERVGHRAPDDMAIKAAIADRRQMLQNYQRRKVSSPVALPTRSDLPTSSAVGLRKVQSRHPLRGVGLHRPASIAFTDEPRF